MKLTLQECWEALNSMKNCKTPGHDGLTKEFYLCCFKQLGKLLVSTLNYNFELEKVYDYIIEGIILRSTATFHEEGEKPSKYFLSLEKSTQ